MSRATTSAMVAEVIADALSDIEGRSVRDGAVISEVYHIDGEREITLILSNGATYKIEVTRDYEQ